MVLELRVINNWEPVLYTAVAIQPLSVDRLYPLIVKDFRLQLLEISLSVPFGALNFPAHYLSGG